MIDLFFFKGYPVAVMGLARSGLTAALALKQSGARVLAWDDSPPRRTEAAAAGVPLINLHEADFAGVAALVLAPGIPHTFPEPNPVAVRAREAGVEIIGDIELLARSEHDATWIGITGTNGKSTTTSLIGHILKLSGRPVAVGGNLGLPVLSLPAMGSSGTYVLELSSYQLEQTFAAPFAVAVMLNITPDHLDRHGGMDGYIRAKTLMFEQKPVVAPTVPMTAIIGVDDEPSREIFQALERRDDLTVIPVAVEHRVAGGVYTKHGVLIDDTESRAVEILDLRPLPALPGRHNWQNAAAAYAAARAVGAHPDLIARSIASFPGLAHRQQRVGQLESVIFVNDSKATNAEAAGKALACYHDIYWILGGKPKEGGLDGLEPLLGRIRHAFLIGAASESFAAWLEGQVQYTRCGTLDVAVRKASEMALAERRSGACVLLSPACASFDQFTDFEARGAAFAAHVADFVENYSGRGGARP
ncbi:MAG: UDP-N-acetylmuramoyl-L-alanine--D-glutamate ligase [Rhodospirillaceae bacterium]